MKYFLKGFIGTFISPFVLIILVVYQTGYQLTRFLEWLFNDTTEE